MLQVQMSWLGFVKQEDHCLSVPVTESASGQSLYRDATRRFLSTMLTGLLIPEVHIEGDTEEQIETATNLIMPPQSEVVAALSAFSVGAGR